MPTDFRMALIVFVIPYLTDILMQNLLNNSLSVVLLHIISFSPVSHFFMHFSVWKVSLLKKLKSPCSKTKKYVFFGQKKPTTQQKPKPQKKPHQKKSPKPPNPNQPTLTNQPSNQPIN